MKKIIQKETTPLLSKEEQGPKYETNLINFLPNEIIIQIFSFNTGSTVPVSFPEGRNLVQLQLVCKRWNEIIKNSNILWKNAGKKDLKILDLDRDCYISVARDIISEKRVISGVGRPFSLSKEKPIKIFRALLLIYGFLLDWINLILFTIFSILLLLKLQSQQRFNYYEVFSPLWVMASLSFIFMLMYEFGTLRFGLKKLSRDDTQLFIEFYNMDSNSPSTIPTIQMALATFNSPFGRIFTWIYFLAISAFVIILPLHLEGKEFITNTVLFAPMIALNSLSVFLSIPIYINANDSWGERRNSLKVFSLVMAEVGLFLSVFFGLLYLHLEENMNRIILFIPIFFLFTILIIQGLLIPCRLNGGRLMIVWCGCWICVGPCLISFTALLLLKLEESTIKYVLIFTPLFLAEGFGFLWLICLICASHLISSDWGGD